MSEGHVVRQMLVALVADLGSSGEVTWVQSWIGPPASTRSLTRADGEVPAELLDLYSVMNGCVLEWRTQGDGPAAGGLLRVPTLRENIAGFEDAFALEVEGRVRLLDAAPVVLLQRHTALWVGNGADGILVYDGNYLWPGGTAVGVMQTGVDRLFLPGWLGDLVGGSGQVLAAAERLRRELGVVGRETGRAR